MKYGMVVIYLFFSPFKDIRTRAIITNSSCGLDKSSLLMVSEGEASIETYPWMGMLYYPMGKTRFTTSVVLVTRQIVIAAATEIEKLPKHNFRSKSRVVLGQKCGVNEIKIRDYSYHPEFNKHSYSALAMVQLNVDHVKIELRPICQPPPYFLEPHFYAMTMSEGCKDPSIRIHKMNYVDNKECKDFYRRSGLGQDSMWPTHTACARAISGGNCVWRSGSVLAMKQEGRWRLLGFSVYGPGCGAPARFLDYGMYHQWIRRSVTTTGMPAVTRLAENYLVLRRWECGTLADVSRLVLPRPPDVVETIVEKIQLIYRFGACDREETVEELYTDRITIFYKPGRFTAQYNVSLYSTVEYSCILFKAVPLHLQTDYSVYGKSPPEELLKPKVHSKKPQIRLRRWCSTPTQLCHGYQFLEIQFYVEIILDQNVEFSMRAYGKHAKIMMPNAALRMANRNTTVPVVPKYLPIFHEMIDKKAEIVRKGYMNWFFVDPK